MPFTIDQFSDDLYGFMAGEGIGKADILGYSDGGNIAMTFALKHPEMTGRLVLSGANAFPSGIRPAFMIPTALSYAAACAAGAFSARARRRKEMLALMVRQPHLSFERLSEIRSPVLVICGTHDVIRDGHSRAIAGAIPGAVFRRIEGGHAAAAENSEAFNKAVLGFLTDGGRRRF